MVHNERAALNIWRTVKRATVFLLIWITAGFVVKHAVCQAINHQRLSTEVRCLETDYQDEMNEYAEVLAENERITSDHDTQIAYLKDKFGYTEPDETPIIILREE